MLGQDSTIQIIQSPADALKKRKNVEQKQDKSEE